MKPARNPYSFDEALERAGLPVWGVIWGMPEGTPLREVGYNAWSLVSVHRKTVGVPEAALLATVDGQYEALDAAYRLGGDAATLAFLKPYLEKLRES